MPDQRLDPKRERWINAGFVLVTLLIAVALFIVAARFALEEKGADGGQASEGTAQQARSR